MLPKESEACKKVSKSKNRNIEMCFRDSTTFRKIDIQSRPNRNREKVWKHLSNNHSLIIHKKHITTSH